MTAIKNKIDFAAVVYVEGANPNGDPLNGNRPRTTMNGLGEISDVSSSVRSATGCRMRVKGYQAR